MVGYLKRGFSQIALNKMEISVRQIVDKNNGIRPRLQVVQVVLQASQRSSFLILIRYTGHSEFGVDVPSAYNSCLVLPPICRLFHL